jgi:hypothetical protein
MHLFVRLTLAVAIALIAFVALLFVLKIIVFAAIVAGLVLAGLFVFNFVRSFTRIRRNELATRQYVVRNLH